MVGKKRLAIITMLGCISISGSNGLFAESFAATARLTSPSLSDSVDKVIQTMSHIDKHLLNDESIKEIEASGNHVVIAVLHRSLHDRELIGEQVNQGRFEEAYMAMKAIEDRFIGLVKLAWAKEYKFQKTLDLASSEYL